MRYLDKENGVKNILKLALIALLLFCTCPCWALSKGALTDKEINYFLTVFNPILIKAHICTQVQPYPMWYEPEGRSYFQREMSLKRII
jgi:hypothetical protein